MSLEKLLKKVQVVAIMDDQLGDSGKGKFSNFFSEWGEVNARSTGGNNADHTAVVNGKEISFHTVPAGIFYDSLGKITILGNGMVIEPKGLCEELDSLSRAGLSYNNLQISKDANVIMPYHIAYDIAKNKSQRTGGIGSTGRGIGPTYTDKIARRGITINDLYNKGILAEKIKRAMQFYPEQNINIEEIIAGLEQYSEKMKLMVRDTVSEMHHFIRDGKKIVIESSQGLLLSIEHGTYPYVTSCDVSVNGTASGVGISAAAIDLPIGLMKFPYMTRLGGGPFPTEMGGKKAFEYAKNDKATKEYELIDNGIPYSKENGIITYDRNSVLIQELMHSNDEFDKGIGIRLFANEYEAIVDRIRRVGWTDAVAAKYAVGINGPKIILTKCDVFSGMDSFRVCYEYSTGLDSYTDFNKDPNFLNKIIPVNRRYEGYPEISGIRQYENLPKTLKSAIFDFEGFTGADVIAVSVGKDKDETIVR
ncbi:MAG: adenylosuccinate synthetase [Candidatus Woesearchaeota archaeon]|nr:adenylosuccinate synthetase [Candidatus Woesearchaeota archaeon]